MGHDEIVISVVGGKIVVCVDGLVFARLVS